jgi:hypothetical protein
LFTLYSAREKGLYAEHGGYYDQPEVYNKIMSIVDKAISESYDIKQRQAEENQKEIDQIRKLGLNIGN